MEKSTLNSVGRVESTRLPGADCKGAGALLKAVLDTCLDAVVTIDTEGRILSFNPSAERIFGYTEAEVLGQEISLLVPPPADVEHKTFIQQFLRTRRSNVVGRGREVTGMRRNGERFPLYLVVSEVQFDDRVYFAGIARDLTDYKRLQSEMVQSQQLAAVGEMAASVAHEIKNPLAGISGAIEILRDTLAPDDYRREIMQEILSEVERLDDTVRDLLAFSRPWNPDLQWCNLRELVERVASSFQEQEEAWELSYRFEGPADIPVRLDPWLFEKVMWNLLGNARDAMPQGGGRIAFSLDQGPGFVEVSIQDSGRGIPEDLLQNVFRPFFTTKNRGTGLGLAICKKIVDAHSGSIRLESAEGKGTKVILRFPSAETRRTISEERENFGI
ncbi:MAG TPA: PAS domain S-box protein [Acidobacteriota bacterium]|jgi:two-component system sensor kinase FixL|nr:PAS domain S-box protein [Acidobacteriota bacterium]HRR55705.1 PAS domain S-box protein [Acidobacteriota bacterium]HRV08004.1 PAS domain S-box protein [Acidobacteriota bacterium]